MPSSAQYDDLWPGGPRFARSGAAAEVGKAAHAPAC